MDSEKDKRFNEWLVVNSQLGDKTAFNTLLQRWQPRFLAFAARRLDDREAAREVVQDVLLDISRSLVRLRSPAAFPAWSYRLLERRCVDSIRRSVAERRKRSKLAETGDDAVSDDTEARLTDELTVERALTRLEPELVLILKLYYQDSLKLNEIAGILNIPAGTVKSRLFYARKILAVVLEE